MRTRETNMPTTSAYLLDSVTMCPAQYHVPSARPDARSLRHTPVSMRRPPSCAPCCAAGDRTPVAPSSSLSPYECSCRWSVSAHLHGWLARDLVRICHHVHHLRAHSWTARIGLMKHASHVRGKAYSSTSGGIYPIQYRGRCGECWAVCVVSWPRALFGTVLELLGADMCRACALNAAAQVRVDFELVQIRGCCGKWQMSSG